MYIYDFIQGLIIGGTLIIAIGPQNLFVIQQGLKKSYVFTVTLFCSLSDSLLIIIGIYLSNYIVQINPSIIGIIKVLGGIWLIFYGLNKVIKLSRGPVYILLFGCANSQVCSIPASSNGKLFFWSAFNWIEITSLDQLKDLALSFQHKYFLIIK